jgi:hypothetical protein
VVDLVSVNVCFKFGMYKKLIHTNNAFTGLLLELRSDSL